MKLLKIGPRVTERFLAKRRFCASAPGSHCWIRVDAAPSARVVASVVATPCGWSMGVMLASGITGVVPSAVVRRPTRSSPSALRLRHAACARVVPRYALATSPTVALLVRFDAIGLRRRAGVIPGAFAPGTTTPGAVRWHWWREKADVLDPKTGGPSSRGAAQTVWAASAAFTAPATDDESEKRKWIQTLLKTGPLAPGLTLSERAHVAGVVLTAATLVMTCVTIVAWTLGGEVLASRLGAATLQAHVLLVAETCARSFFGPASRSRSFVADPRAPHVRRERRASRDASAFLVLDVWLLCFAALHTASLCGAVRFADPNFATSLAVSWPLAICNWIGRLASETRVHIFDDVAVAVARKETTAMRRATRARRLGGSPAPKGGPPPPDAGPLRRIRYASALTVEQWREAAICGSARFFRRVTAVCCVFDWLVLAGMWTALGVVGVGGSFSQAALLPLAACLFLDAARLAAQLTHSRLLVAARSHAAEPDAASPFAKASPDATALGFNPFVNIKALPAGMTARLTRATYALNVWNVALTAVAVVLVGNMPGGAVTSGPSASFTASLIAVARVVASARFLRLVTETAYLSAALLTVVDRPVIVTPGAPHANDVVTSLKLDLHDLGVDGDLAGAVAERLAAARALASRLSNGFSKDGAFPGTAFPLHSALGSSETVVKEELQSPAAMTLPEFTEAISPGLRGYLVGARAESAAAKVFHEMTGGGDIGTTESVGLADIQRWLAYQPSLRSSSGKALPPGSSVKEGTSNANTSDVEVEIRWRRSVQRVLLRLVRRAEFGRGRQRAASRGGGVNGGGMIDGATDAGASGVVSSDANASSVVPTRGLRLLSLEGGGIKGLALIWQLRALERAAGRPMHELFDLIGGVSTGGIIALGLARGVSLLELEKMYHDIGRDVFGSQSAVRRLLKGNAADNTAIRNLLLEYLGDLPMLDAPDQLVRCFVVSTQQTERLEVRLLRTYRKKEPNAGRDAHEGWRQWEAGMATSSAPTVFPPFVRENVGVLVNEAPGVTAVSDGSTKATEGSTKDSLSDPTNRSGISVSVAKNTRGSSRKEKKQKDSVPRQVFIDGALSGYNNPSSLVLNEGLDLAEPGQQIDVLLSLGCGEVTGGASGESENGDRGLVFWLGQVVNLAFDVELQEAHVASLISRFSPQTMHVRLNPPTGGVSLTEHRPEVLQRMEVDTAQYLAENRMVFADVAAALVDNRGFAEVHAAPSTPWDHPGYFETGFGSNTDALLASMGGDTKFGGAGAMMNGMSGNSTSQNASGKNEMYDKAFSAFEGFRNPGNSFGGGKNGNANTRSGTGGSVTVRKGPQDWGKNGSERRVKSAPVAPGLDRFPSFPGPGTARSAAAAERRAAAAKAFAEQRNESSNWVRFFWGKESPPAPATANDDLGETEETQPLREQVALGEVPDVDLTTEKTQDESELSKTSVVSVVETVTPRLGWSSLGEQIRVQSVSVKSWLDGSGAEFVAGWDDDDAGKGISRKKNGDDDEAPPQKTSARTR